eukprot:TRINITY_DN12310_c0_g1_i1.p1 TRINITY_DN12310_c0_g1~~TRINITY_DN12310_c0_g1_i1.p1  ORF type:complete len:899 (-),score=146.47 TRINITY_DN12310_c0_g1_i1:76-2772(-)
MNRHCLIGFVFICLALAVFAQSFCNPNGVRLSCCSGCSQSDCESQGCCYQPSTSQLPGATCYTSNPPVAGYYATDIVQSDYGYFFNLTLTQGGAFYGSDIQTLSVNVYFETEDRLHIKITDPNSPRWEVPNIVQTPTGGSPKSLHYDFSFTHQPFTFAVTRKSTGEVLFNSSTSPETPFNNLVFEDQYLELSTQLPNNPNIYGLGERVHPIRLTTNELYTLFNLDEGTPLNNNLYGSHAFYLDLRNDTGNAHGVFLLNSNGMDVLLSNNSLTYRVIGGVFDLYFFQGPTAEDAVRQYHQVIGYPHMPPYWGLGFNQCRWGYHTIWETEEVVKNYSLANIPLDTMWNDIDYMYQYYDFTFDPDRFPQPEVKSFVDRLHADGQHYITIVDCGIPNVTGYRPWDDGVSEDIFIRNANGSIFIGQVWPGLTAWTDFYHPNASSYWQAQISDFLSMVPVDGLWIDMNEISNFCSGECSSSTSLKYRRRRSTDSGFNPNNPPYAINNMGSQAPLNYHTVSPDALHYNDVLEYNLHNMYGLLEANATKLALENLRKERSVVIGRSTFPGDGHVAAHWLGDNTSEWPDLYLAIPGILNFQFFGVPLVGADICGFNGNTTEQLCARWMQVGSFYPFSRNHNSIGSIPQEPYRWPLVANISAVTLRIRYSLLPFYYSLFYRAHNHGGVVAQPLFYICPTDPVCVVLDTQFMIGTGLLVSPVLTENATTVEAYFPQGVWYDYYNHSAIVSKDGGQWLELDAPIEKINLHLYGGTIIPSQFPENTTTATRLNNFDILVPLNLSGQAVGFLYWDDGVSLFATSNNSEASSLIQFSAEYDGSNGVVQGDLSWANFDTDLLIANVTVIGVNSSPSSATFNGDEVAYKYDATSSTLWISVGLQIFQNFTLKWTA